MFERSILVTGGAGFIGSHLCRLLVNKYPNYQIVNFDKLTYAGNLANLQDIESAKNYVFVKGDICNADQVSNALKSFNIDSIIHLAAESHVDRSISDPSAFILTNVLGTTVLLNEFRSECASKKGARFYHVSTDEVYGSLGKTGFFTEDTAYDPRSPYSASKASSDHVVRAYHHTYKLPVIISNCSNNYGSYQFPEKLIPLMINNIRNYKSLPVYGEGLNVRDWLWVQDHVEAIDLIFHEGPDGETYNIGGNNEWKNIDLVHLLCEIMDKKLPRAEGSNKDLITFVKDRAGHDLRYAIDAGKLKRELGWEPSITFEKGLEQTVDWYLEHTAWIDEVASGAYVDYYAAQYQNR
jgi:dTDP-glucose 4,6-dehydratase